MLVVGRRSSDFVHRSSYSSCFAILALTIVIRRQCETGCLRLALVIARATASGDAVVAWASGRESGVSYASPISRFQRVRPWLRYNSHFTLTTGSGDTCSVDSADVAQAPSRFRKRSPRRPDCTGHYGQTAMCTTS
jgi:hypothetical protein